MDILKAEIKKYINSEFISSLDSIAVEEPLEISLVIGGIEHKISVTMRTPGQDQELALGFLFTEGILQTFDQVLKIENTEMNKIRIFISDKTQIDLSKLSRNFYTTSSCGVCGKSSIEAIHTISETKSELNEKINIDPKIILSLKGQINQFQSNFLQTGGIHASVLFNLSGQMESIYEDVGRHNALDKLIGHYFSNNQPQLTQHILVLSGRASFELIQKAAMANISVICALGAPSSLAIELAESMQIGLIGFLKDHSFNIYTSHITFI